jgi:hypothetical protein
MSDKRIRRKDFEPEHTDFRGAMHWLRQRGLSPAEIASIFEKTTNYTSVSVHNEDLRLQERQPLVPEVPDYSVAELCLAKLLSGHGVAWLSRVNTYAIL